MTMRRRGPHRGWVLGLCCLTVSVLILLGVVMQVAQVMACADLMGLDTCLSGR